VKRIVWTGPAKADVRSLSKPTAMHVLSALHRFAESGTGNVKALQGREELRLRIGDTAFSSSAWTLTQSKFGGCFIGQRRIGKMGPALQTKQISCLPTLTGSG
jgi:hypothetical protein